MLAKSSKRSSFSAIALLPVPEPRLAQELLRRLGSQALIQYALQTVRAVPIIAHVVVLTDDEELELLCRRADTRVLPIPPGVPQHDLDTLLPAWGQVIAAEEAWLGRCFDAVLIYNPAAPCIEPGDLIGAGEFLNEHPQGIVVSAEEPQGWLGDRLWDTLAHGAAPLRQNPDTIRFTACFRWISRACFHSLVTAPPMAYLIPPDRSAVVRSRHDWWICEKLLHRKRIVFAVTGNHSIGMGHVYRALTLAHELTDDEIHFVCIRGSDLAYQHLVKLQQPVSQQCDDPLVDSVLQMKPDLVINDILDTEATYVRALKQAGARVINFEDLGPGALEADLVVNALYTPRTDNPRWLSGPDYFLLRDEFMHAPRRSWDERLNEVLVTYGGVDLPDQTGRAVRLLLPLARDRGFHISVVTGPGYLHHNKLEDWAKRHAGPELELAAATRRMSEFMGRADLALSSAGRTVLELAAMGVPGIITAANLVEESHRFAMRSRGMLYLGPYHSVRDETLRRVLVRLLDDPERRRSMRQSLLALDLRQGKSRVLNAIRSVLHVEGETPYAAATYRAAGN